VVSADGVGVFLVVVADLPTVETLFLAVVEALMAADPRMIIKAHHAYTQEKAVLN
jgi:hypothetical protein